MSFGCFSSVESVQRSESVHLEQNISPFKKLELVVERVTIRQERIDHVS
jgi:hypothetical protein